MKACIHYLKFMTCTLLILPVISILNLQAQDTEYKDAPYFTGMPTYVIDYAEDIEFDSTRFFNGINCPIVEGKKYLRLYVLKEGATQASQLQIVRNYSNALKSIGGTVFINGVYDGAKCPDLNDLYMMVGKVVKDGNEVWVEVLPENNGANYRLTEVIKGVMKQDVNASGTSEALKSDNRNGVMKQDVNASGIYEALKRDSRKISPFDDINLPKSIYLTDVIDIDGNVYRTVKIGNQTWMVENLTAIPLVTDDTQWRLRTTPGFCWYNNDEASYKDVYGALYNWYSVNTGKLCPIGWHMPTDNEWGSLSDYLGGDYVAGGKLKETGTTHWNSPNEGATNETGFTALPGGYRNQLENQVTQFGFSGITGKWWASTRGMLMSMNNDWDDITKYFTYYDEVGLSVRCLKD
jgi:uncharacterized protein (TIGR02145 family)